MKQVRIIAALMPLVACAVYGQQNESPAPAAAAASESASSSQPAPPEVERALRVRVQEFFEDCAQRRYREAEKMIDEASRDIFYDNPKPGYNSFDEITKIEWSDNFTRATVTARAAMDMPMQTIVLHAHPLVPTEWHLIDGQWYLHIPTATEGLRMPFFPQPVKIPASQVPTGAQPPLPEGGLGSISQKDMKEKADLLLHGVKPDRTDIQLNSGKPATQTIHLRNTTPGPVGLGVAMKSIPGLSVTLDKSQLGPNETAVATIHWKPHDNIAKPTCILHVQVLPLGQDIEVMIRFGSAVQKESASVPK